MFDCADVEPTGDLFGASDCEAVTCDHEKAAVLELVLKRFGFRFGAFQHGVGLADRVGEGFVREIVKSGIGRVACAMGELLGLG